MAETIKCVCGKCGAKYRLPLEAQGRTARCKRCGEKFDVPRQESLEDSVLTWLTGPDEDDAEDRLPEKPRIISMPTQKPDEAEAAELDKRRGPIRMKSGASKSESA